MYIINKFVFILKLKLKTKKKEKKTIYIIYLLHHAIKSPHRLIERSVKEWESWNILQVLSIKKKNCNYKKEKKIILLWYLISVFLYKIYNLIYVLKNNFINYDFIILQSRYLSFNMSNYLCKINLDFEKYIYIMSRDLYGPEFSGPGQAWPVYIFHL